ncbi:MAG: replication initiator protein A [Pseudomonadota bacterium]|nr:replication initiator protein A [Pseudomonadota bacterium]
MKKKIPPVQRDLFLAELVDWPVKDDIHSMEYPIFSLAKNRDKQIREFVDERSQRTLRVIPSVYGAATVFDKDILIFAMSQIVDALNRGNPVSRTIQFETFNYLTATGRSDGGADFTRAVDSLRRLRGTTLETNIETGETVQLEGFGLLEDYSVVRKTASGKGALTIRITLSDWLYRALMSFEVLTLPRQYFELSQPLERRLYELARKHTGRGAYWVVSMERLLSKSGSRQDIYGFTRSVKQIMSSDALPDYRIALDASKRPAHVVFFSRDWRVLLERLQTDGRVEWFENLKKSSTPPKKEPKSGPSEPAITQK